MHIGWFVSRRLHSREACKLLLFTLPMHYGLSWIRKDVRDRPFVSLRRKVETLQCIGWTVNNCQFIETNASQATPYALNIVVVANIKSRNRAFSTHTHTLLAINVATSIIWIGLCSLAFACTIGTVIECESGIAFYFIHQTMRVWALSQFENK